MCERFRKRESFPLTGGCGLFPTMRSFDFKTTAAGAEWIDEIASKAKRVLDNPPGRMVVGHTDWSAKYFRFQEGKVCAVYDWDSLRLDKETTLVGHTAAHFPYTEYFDVPRRASPEEARLFVEEYEMARGAPFSKRERIAVSAAATYGLSRTRHAASVPWIPRAKTSRAASGRPCLRTRRYYSVSRVN
jgi:hypothetical protein